MDERFPSLGSAAGPSRRRVLVWLCAGLAALMAATWLDVPLAGWVNAHHPLDKSGQLAWWMRRPGHGTFPAAAAALLLLNCRRWAAPALVALAGAFSSANWLLKWLVGRTRPFRGSAAFDLQPLKGGLGGLFGQVNLSFPSGDASVAFATAGALAILFPRWRWAFYALATVTAAERILENAHYLSDVVGGAILGIGVAHLAVWLVRRTIYRMQHSSASSVVQA